jgi:hypothetical protein
MNALTQENHRSDLNGFRSIRLVFYLNPGIEAKSTRRSSAGSLLAIANHNLGFSGQSGAYPQICM